jgi:hypothetical protein
MVGMVQSERQVNGKTTLEHRFYRTFRSKQDRLSTIFFGKKCETIVTEFDRLALGRPVVESFFQQQEPGYVASLWSGGSR